jgi:hypothetical protein
MPEGIAKAAALKLGALPTPGEDVSPRNHAGTWPVLLSGIGGRLSPRVGSGGELVFWSGSSFTVLKRDGTPGDPLRVAAWTAKTKPHHGLYRWHMGGKGSAIAVSPDGKSVCLTGLWQKKPFKGKTVFPPGRVYRARLSGGKGLEKLADVEGLKGPTGGCDFDAKGNLLVCAPSDGAVVAISPEGKRLGEIRTGSPGQVLCDRKRGGIYVLSCARNRFGGGVRPTKLSKFPGLGAEEPAWTLNLQGSAASGAVALDDSGEKPVIWIASSRGRGGSGWQVAGAARIWRVEDDGGSFRETDHNIKLTSDPGTLPARLAVHPETDVVVSRGEYSHCAAYEGLTGKRLKTPFKYATDMGVGLDGIFYIQEKYGWDGPLCKYDGRLRPVPVPGMSAGGNGNGKTRGGANQVVPRIFGRWGSGFGVAGVTADPTGRIYSMQQINQHTVAGDVVVVFDPRGKAEDHGRMKGDPKITQKHKIFESAIFGPIKYPVGGIQVDWKGNMYLGLRVVPLKHKPPAGFEKDPAYHAVVGSVVKVAPEGGSMIDTAGPEARPARKPGKVPAGAKGLEMIHRNHYPCGRVFVENALAAYPGLGCMGGGFGPGCRCRQAMFQLDGGGRLFIPNAITYSVNVVDNAGNRVLKFGRYGNADSKGPEAAGGPIPLGWPEAVGVSNRAVYVADVLNHRIVRLLKTYEAEKSVAVK